MSNYDEVMSDQYGGNHYKDKAIQPWEVWEAYDMNGWEASALKYLLRYKSKGKPIEDLYKCKHNVEYLIAKLEREAKYVQTNESQGQSTKVFDNVVQRLQSGTERTTPNVSTKDAFEFWGTPSTVSNA
jgi:hypothetical protein